MCQAIGLVNIRSARVGSGFSDGGQPFVKGHMELDGTVMGLFYREHRSVVSREMQTYLSVEIEFTESQERSEDIESHVRKAYIGRCHMEITDKEIRSLLRITLPIRMYRDILLLGQDQLVYETIQDATEGERTGHVVAYITRVYFEKRYW